MKNIKAIFRSDIKALLKNPIALIIALGLCILPALYAWFNIYSNWDPYGNTGNIRIAVASMDKGYVDDKGKEINVGDGVLENLKENKGIHWVFTTPAKVKKGVNSGEYYAGILLSQDFSECMYNGFAKGLKHPKVTYYENDKKNAVATKITDTAVSNLKNNINEMYVSIIVSNLFEEEKEVVEADSKEETITKFQEKIEEINLHLQDDISLIDGMIAANAKLDASLQDGKTQLANGKATLKKEKAKITDGSLKETVESGNTYLSATLERVNQRAGKAKATSDYDKKAEYYKKMVNDLQAAKTKLEAMKGAMEIIASSSPTLEAQYNSVITKINTHITKTDALITKLNTAISTKKALGASAEEELKNMAQALKDDFTKVVEPLTNAAAEAGKTVVGDISNSLDSITEDMDVISSALTGVSSSVSAADKSLASLKDALTQVSKQLDDVKNTVSSVSESQFVSKIKKFMEGDPDGYGAFFAAPVTITTKAVYPVDNYGSGVTPFYTTLALWVGGIFLVALIKVRPGKEKMKKLKPYEAFLGRFILFFLLGQIQALIIVLGNLYIFHVQCLHPFQFWLACAIASTTFILLIYSLTVAFGDIGKALVVVLVVIQIAGSSGTYPIEILPTFYQKVYIFFPFPYAINAMRETICGMNGHDYVIYLIELSMFAVVSLLLGLVIRLPFRDVNRFVEKRMADTDMM